jgi:hypothetical protein
VIDDQLLIDVGEPFVGVSPDFELLLDDFEFGQAAFDDQVVIIENLRNCEFFGKLPGKPFFAALLVDRFVLDDVILQDIARPDAEAAEPAV